jgi:DNA-directed RNA polymerase subunit H (RpoH/RPB5)
MLRLPSKPVHVVDRNESLCEFHDEGDAEGVFAVAVIDARPPHARDGPNKAGSHKHWAAKQPSQVATLSCDDWADFFDALVKMWALQACREFPSLRVLVCSDRAEVPVLVRSRLGGLLASCTTTESFPHSATSVEAFLVQDLLCDKLNHPQVPRQRLLSTSDARRFLGQFRPSELLVVSEDDEAVRCLGGRPGNVLHVFYNTDNCCISENFYVVRERHAFSSKSSRANASGDCLQSSSSPTSDRSRAGPEEIREHELDDNE